MLTVETGTGLPTADSYLSVADADTYWSTHGSPADWISAEDTDKETALRLATQNLEARFLTIWSGRRVYQGQALAWPRYGVRDADGFPIFATTIPARLQYATAEMALRVLQMTAAGTSVMPDMDTPGSVRSESVKIGPIETATTYAGPKQQQPIYSIVDALLRDLIRGGGNGRVERA